VLEGSRDVEELTLRSWGFDLLFHLNLVVVPLLLVELCSETSQLLSFIRRLVGFAGDAFALSLVMIKTPTVYRTPHPPPPPFFNFQKRHIPVWLPLYGLASIF
jgi:hypothetical protein